MPKIVDQITSAPNEGSVWPDEPIIAHGPNPAGARDLVVGDLHGHFDTLEHALEQLAFDESTDRLFSVGDLIDRGPRSEAALEWLDQDRIAPVRGNHEQMMITTLTLDRGDLRKSGPSARWMDNGGGWWWGFKIDESGSGVWRDTDNHANRKRWLDAMRKVPYLRTMKCGDALIAIAHTIADYASDWADECESVRAGAEYARRGYESSGCFGTTQTPTHLLWSRPKVEREDRCAPDLPAPIEGITCVITGHTPDMHPRWTRRNVLCIDTGVHVDADGYGHLTIAEVQTGEPRLHRFARVEGHQA